MTLAGKKFATAAAEPYDYKKGWDKLEQPDPDLGARDYIELATHAAPGLSQSARDFCDENGLSFVEIPHSVFADEYEKRTIPFRQWVNAYCERNHLPKNVDVVIIGPRIKSLESAERKQGDTDKRPSQTADYVGIMMVAMKKGAPVKGRKNKKDLAVLEKVIDAIEEDPRSLARKNSYFHPNDVTGHRDHKSIWEIVIASGGYKGWKMHGEVKVEDESQMDVNRQTRNHSMALSRKTGTYLSTLHSSVASDSNITGHSRRAKERRDFTTRVGVESYNRFFADNGFNLLMDPALLHKHAPMSHEDIIRMIFTEARKNSTTRGQAEHLITGVINSGVLQPAGKTYRIPAQLHEHVAVLH